MRDNLRSIDKADHAALFDRMEREIAAHYRRERMEDALWWVSIVLSLSGIILILGWVR